MKTKCWLCPYSFLRLLLPLPSRCTLQSILSTVHFAAGINARVFGALQHSVQKMSDRDRYCCLLFDEMSIRENVHFSQKLDCIEGFEDYGTERTRWIANHALLFMVRGLHRKWKQPVTYYFIRGSTKAELLVRFIAHARMLDGELLPLSVTWLRTTSRP